MHNQTRHFNKITEHAASLPYWSQYYDQLTPGNFHGFLQDVQLKGIRLFREVLSSGVAQHTHTPPQQISLLLPINLRSHTDVTSGQNILANGINFLPFHSDIFFVTPPDTDYVVISLECETLENLLAVEDIELFYQRPSGYAVKLPTERLFCGRMAILDILKSLDIAGEPCMQEFRNRTLTTVLDMLEPSCPVRFRRLGGNHHYIVKYCHERVMDCTAGESLSILDLCRELNIPRRTLHYSFEKITGSSPLPYLRAIRLNAAQRSLAREDTNTIADIAYRWGFSHLSYFSQEYKRLFGHSPSTFRNTR